MVIHLLFRNAYMVEHIFWKLNCQHLEGIVHLPKNENSVTIYSQKKVFR